MKSAVLLLLSALVAFPAFAQQNEPDAIERLLEELTNAHGPTGYEGPVRAIVRRELEPVADELTTDGLGSLIARLDGSADGPRVMLAAHMDQVGMIVKRITPDGYLKFQTLGGILSQALINQRYLIRTRTGMVLGVAGLKTPHVMSGDERSRLVETDQIFLDVGATSQRDAEERLGIRPGDPIAPDSRFARLNDPKLYVGKAWDDRIGLAVEIEVLKRLKRNPLPIPSMLRRRCRRKSGYAAPKRAATSSSRTSG